MCVRRGPGHDLRAIERWGIRCECTTRQSTARATQRTACRCGWGTRTLNWSCKRAKRRAAARHSRERPRMSVAPTQISGVPTYASLGPSGSLERVRVMKIRVLELGHITEMLGWMQRCFSPECILAQYITGAHTQRVFESGRVVCNCKPWLRLAPPARPRGRAASATERAEASGMSHAPRRQTIFAASGACWAEQAARGVDQRGARGPAKHTAARRSDAATPRRGWRRY